MGEPRVDVKIQAHVEVDEMRKMEAALQREIVQLRPIGAELDEIKAKEGQLLEMRTKLAG